MTSNSEQEALDALIETSHEIVAVLRGIEGMLDQYINIAEDQASSLADIAYFSTPRWLRWKLAFREARHKDAQRLDEKITVTYGHYGPDNPASE